MHGLLGGNRRGLTSVMGVFVVLAFAAFPASGSTAVRRPARPKPCRAKPQVRKPASCRPAARVNSGPGDYAERIAEKLLDPASLKLLIDIAKGGGSDAGVERVLRELAGIKEQLAALDVKLDQIAAQIAEIKTNQYWIELQKYIGEIDYVQEQLDKIARERSPTTRKRKIESLAKHIEDKLAPHHVTFQKFVMTVPGAGKGIIGAISSQERLLSRFWGAPQLKDLGEAYEYYAPYEVLLASELGQATIALADSSEEEQHEAEKEARELMHEAIVTIKKQVAELPKPPVPALSWMIDQRVRLIWFTNLHGAPVGIGEAEKQVRESTLGGFKDWRLPSRPEFEEMGPCQQRNYRDPCAYATYLPKTGWKLPAACSGRNIWWTSSRELGEPAGFVWYDAPPMRGFVATNPGNACVLQVRRIGETEKYWL